MFNQNKLEDHVTIMFEFKMISNFYKTGCSYRN